MKTTTILRNLLLVLAIVGWASAAPAEVLFTETFSYPNGRLTSVSGGLWTINSGGGPLNVSNGKVTLFHISANCCGVTISGEDVSREYSALTAGQTLYVGLDVSASGNTTEAGVSGPGLRFAGTGATALFVTAFTGSDFTFGIGNSIFTPAASWPNGLAFGATYRVVMSYEFDLGISKLWVNPAGESSTYVSFTDTENRPLYASFNLSQRATPSFTPSATQVLDNLVLGTSFDDVLTVPASALGDYNGDGQVDGSDFLNWQCGESPNPLSAADLTAWKANFGSELLVAASQPVAEPASWWLALAGASITCLRGCTRMSHFRVTC